MPAVSAHDRHSHPALGIAFKLASVVCLSGMAACVKLLGSGVPAGQTIFVRGVISMFVLTLIASRSGGLHLLTTRNWRAHAMRSLAGSASMFCWFTALTMIPLAQMTAISFTIPLFLTVLAMIFLGERIHVFRWTALGVGFAGVMIIVAPQLSGGSGNIPGIAISLLAAILAAFALLALRRMSGEEHALTITFYFFATSSTLAAISWLFIRWPAPTPTQWLLLGLTGLFGVLGQLFMSYCYRYAEASLVAPLDYVNMLLSVAIGFYLFSEIPLLTTWLGAPLVIASGAIIIWREYAQHKRVRSMQEGAT